MKFSLLLDITFGVVVYALSWHKLVYVYVYVHVVIMLSLRALDWFYSAWIKWDHLSTTMDGGWKK